MQQKSTSVALAVVPVVPVVDLDRADLAGADSASPDVFAELARRFLLGYGEATRAAYLGDLREFTAWCLQTGRTPLTATRTDVDAYVAYLGTARGLAPRTVARRLATLSAFFRRAVEEGLLARSPVTAVRRPKTGRGTPSTGLSAEELRRLIDAARAAGPRLYGLIVLLALTGLRISEALGADITDLDLDHGVRVLRVRRKGGWTDTIPLATPVQQALQPLLAGREVGPLFTTRTGRRWDRTGAWKGLRRLAATALPGRSHFHPHDLRHTFVTLALEAGVPLHLVQDAAGHADPRTTRHYDRARHRLTGHPGVILADAIGAWGPS